MKQLNSFMVLAVGGGDRISFTYDVINNETGQPIEQNTKENFYVVNDDLKYHIAAIKQYIINNKLIEE